MKSCPNERLRDRFGNTGSGELQKENIDWKWIDSYLGISDLFRCRCRVG